MGTTWVGADWDSEKCVIEAEVDGRILQRKVARHPEAVSVLVEELGADELVVGLEAGDPLWERMWEEAGAEVVSVDPRYTSQVCSRCGCLVKKSLSDRVHRCLDCGLVLDRDVNAAINVLNRMLSARTERQGANVVGCDKRSPGSSLL